MLHARAVEIDLQPPRLKSSWVLAPVAEKVVASDTRYPLDDMEYHHNRIGEQMTSKSDFTEDEWRLILETPPTAGMIVVTAQRGGSFRETIAMAKAYAEARKEHGKSQLLDEIVAAKPERDHTHFHSHEELEQQGLRHLRDSVALLAKKATPEEVDEYRRFIVTLSNKVAAAHREHGQDVSESEQKAIQDITDALSSSAE